MVWPWPNTPKSHNPILWVFGMGKFNFERWRRAYTELFNSHKLVLNIRNIQKIVVSSEGDGAFAVVDVDTLWLNKKTMKDFTGKDEHVKSIPRWTMENGK